MKVDLVMKLILVFSGVMISRRQFDVAFSGIEA